MAGGICLRSGSHAIVGPLETVKRFRDEKEIPYANLTVGSEHGQQLISPCDFDVPDLARSRTCPVAQAGHPGRSRRQPHGRAILTVLFFCHNTQNSGLWYNRDI